MKKKGEMNIPSPIMLLSSASPVVVDSAGECSITLVVKKGNIKPNAIPAASSETSRTVISGRIPKVIKLSPRTAKLKGSSQSLKR